MSKSIAAGRVGKDLTQGPIMRTLLSFAIPIVLTNLVQQLYSLVDLIVIGQFVGTVGTVGVNTGGEVTDMMMPFAIGMATAGQIYIAQLTGAKQEEKIKRSVGTLFGFIFVLSLCFAALIIIFTKPILSLLNCPEEALGQAGDYMRITALGLPFIFGYNAVVGVLRGIGESKRPLIFILVAATVNIFLDLLLVVVIPMEAAGTAIATVMSQVGAFTAAFIFMWKYRQRFDFRLRLSYFRIDPQILKVLLKLGLPEAGRSFLVRVSMLWIHSVGNSYGLVVSATLTVGHKLQKFLEVFIQSVDTASAAMIGQNLGAGKVERAGRISCCTLAATMTCSFIVAAMCFICPEFVYSLFTKDAAVIELGRTFMHIMVVHILAAGVLAGFQGMVTGSGNARLKFITGSLDGFVCKFVLVALFVYVFDMGYLGLFWGSSSSRVVSASIYTVYFLSGKWRERRLLTEE